MSQNATLIGDIIPQLSNLASYAPDAGSVHYGGQNFTYCCLMALDQSLFVNSSGDLIYATTNYVDPSVMITDLTTLLTSDDSDLFPCGATYDGSSEGSPEVRVPYRWCQSQCAGWEKSHSTTMQQWIGPAVQFIIPSLAFCLNIPRTRSLRIPDIVFGGHPRSVLGLASYWLRLLAAMLLMTVDTFLWLAICFAFAGPMLLSAVFEYMVDRKVLEFICPPGIKTTRPKLPTRLKAQFLIAIVAGNIRITTVGKTNSFDSIEASTVSTSRASRTWRNNSTPSPPPDCKRKSDCAMSGDDRTENLDLERFDTITHRLVKNAIWSRIMTMIDDHERLVSEGVVGFVSLSTKLKSILNSQPSFGTTMGAPILFFVGGFIYTVLDVENNLGDNDTAHALAFGLWWMVIPYLAIISSAMLAANEPFALEGLVFDGGKAALKDTYDTTTWIAIVRRLRQYHYIDVFVNSLNGYNLVEHCFDGHFKTVKLWKRGINKGRWVQEAIDDYEMIVSRGEEARLQSALSPSGSGGSARIAHKEEVVHAGFMPPQDVREALSLSFLDIWNVGVGSSFLMLTPCILAFLVSYHTPRNGLSCRSLTYLIYGISQVCEMLLWSWEAYLKIKYGAQRWTRTRTPAKLVCWWGQVFVGFFAILAAVGGTMMQLLGVYRSCVCRIPVTFWNGHLDDPSAYIVLSSNSAASIEAAGTWWTYIAIAAVATVSIVCSLAWWHQRRLKKVFQDIADSLDSTD